MIVKTEETFDASHHLENYKGKCSEKHGHRWKVEVRVKGNIGEDDMVVDFGTIKNIVRELDHCDLNEKINLNPTAENICNYLVFKIEKKLWEEERTPYIDWICVKVFESPESYVEKYEWIR